LEGWNVTALVAHHAVFVPGLGYLAANPVDAAPTIDAVGMLRRFNAPNGVARTSAAAIADAARQHAESMARTDLVATFRDTAPRVIDAVSSAGPIVVDYFGQGPFPLAEAVAIGTLEAVVHGLDLASAVGVSVPSPLPAGAMADTGRLLATMAIEDDVVAFIEAATGRRDGSDVQVLR
jgi:hypothetical protein